MLKEAVKTRKRRATQIALLGHDEVKRLNRARYAASQDAKGKPVRAKREQVLPQPEGSTVTDRTARDQEGSLTRIYFRMTGDWLDLTSATQLEFFVNAPVLEYIMNEDSRLKSDNTKITYIANILGFFKHRKGFDEARPAYSKQLIELKGKIDATRSHNRITDNEEGSTMPYSKLLAAYETAQDLRDKFVMALFLKTPPRRLLDYMYMKVGPPPAARTGVGFNYMTQTHFVFNRYKTFATYGQQRIRIPEEIKELATALDFKSGALLFPQDGDPSKPQEFGRLVTSIFKRHTGLPITINGLRKSYASANSSDKSNFELAELATAMGTSTKELANYKRMSLIEH